MNGCESFDGFHFDDDRVCHEQIDAIPAIESDAAINERQRLLALEWQAAFHETKRKTFFVARFHKPRPEFAIDVESATDDALGDCVCMKIHAFPLSKTAAVAYRTFLLEIQDSRRNVCKCLPDLHSKSCFKKSVDEVRDLCEVCGSRTK